MTENYWNISFGTFLKILCWLLVGYLIYLLWNEILIFILAAFLAAATTPILDRAEKHKMRGLTLVGLALGEAIAVIGVAFYIIPPMADQVNRLMERLPFAVKRVLAHIPDTNILKVQVMNFAEKGLSSVAQVSLWAPGIATAGKYFFSGITLILLLYVFQVYLMIDGKRLYLWIASFFQDENREKLDRTGNEILPVISSYILGQFITSVLCSLVVYALLSVLSVPAAITLAVMAGVFDILPVVGFFLSGIPAVIFALTVSPTAALIVLISYTAYHLFEAYFLGPWVYGKKLEMSGLAVIISLIVGGTLGGILGAIIILPVAASYPIIERIWLKQVLGKKVIAEHRQIEK